jgi:hypothetical protein
LFALGFQSGHLPIARSPKSILSGSLAIDIPVTSLGSLPDGLGALSHNLLDLSLTVTRRPHSHSDLSINAAQVYIFALVALSELKLDFLPKE